MPTWLSFICAIAVVIASAYLLYVIIRPERF